jgi:hypothetical protein
MKHWYLIASWGKSLRAPEEHFIVRADDEVSALKALRAFRWDVANYTGITVKEEANPQTPGWKNTDEPVYSVARYDRD